MPGAAGASAIAAVEEEQYNRTRNDDDYGYGRRKAPEGSHEGPAALQLIFRILEARGPKDSMNLLRDVLESMKLVQAITGTGAAASFVHANSYSDTRGEAFGVLTALSTILAFIALIVTVIMYVSLGLLEHEDMVAVEGYLVRYWSALAAIITSSLVSMILLVAAVVVDAFHTYSRTSAICLLLTTCLCLFFTIVFWISSTKYVFTSGAVVRDEEGDSEPESKLNDENANGSIRDVARESPLETELSDSDMSRRSMPSSCALLCG